MSGLRFSSLFGTLFLPLLFIVSVPSAVALDEEDDNEEPPELCPQPSVESIGPAPYLNGLPLVQEEVELVGDAVKVWVKLPLFCRLVAPTSLPFRWVVIGPTGPVTLTNGETRRPRFRPSAAGQYQAQMIYCPETCHNVHVESTTMDIPPQMASFDFTVVDEIPLPPNTEPTPTSWANEEGFTQWVDVDHQERVKKCGGSGWGLPPEIETPQLVVIGSWSDQYPQYQLVEGRVTGIRIAGHDNHFNHYSHDVIAHVAPDRRYAKLKVPAENGVEKEDMEVEWESAYYPPQMRPLPSDRISAFGFHTYDCRHNDEKYGILAEIHPPVLTAVHRRRPIRIPDGWHELGTNIYVPGIITDIYANKRAGVMSSECAETGLHQHASITPNGQIQWGDCIQSPHPLNQQFNFHIYLPPNPQERMAAAGVNVPPAPLYWNVESGGEHIIAAPGMLGNVTFLNVFVDLTGYNEQQYTGRIVAGWVQPSPDNWGLERWKVGIQSIGILNDHDPDPFDDGDWVFWAAINNRDQEWTRLLDGEAVTGLHTFNPPFETESQQANRSLGSHLLLFHPHVVDFPGLPLEDLNRSFFLHSSAYDADPQWDDEVGAVNRVYYLGGVPTPIGTRTNLSFPSDQNPYDYTLQYFVERLGPVLPSLTAAGRALVSTYSLHPQQARCEPARNGACVLFPERFEVAKPWHPQVARLDQKGAALDWRNFPAFKAQEREELGFTGISFPEFRAWLLRTRSSDPKRVEQFMVDLRQQFDKVRGTRMETEDSYAKAFSKLKANIPADLWQRHFSDIGATPTTSSKFELWLGIGALIVLVISLAFWLTRRRIMGH